MQGINQITRQHFYTMKYPHTTCREMTIIFKVADEQISRRIKKKSTQGSKHPSQWNEEIRDGGSVGFLYFRKTDRDDGTGIKGCTVSSSTRGGVSSTRGSKCGHVIPPNTMTQLPSPSGLSTHPGRYNCYNCIPLLKYNFPPSLSLLFRRY